MRRLTFLMAFLFWALGTFAQEAPSTGKVVDESGKALQGANVVAYGAGGKVLSYAITGEDGTFLLKKRLTCKLPWETIRRVCRV